MTSGTFFYSPIIFVVPVVVLIRVGMAIASRNQPAAQPRAARPATATPAPAAPGTSTSAPSSPAGGMPSAGEPAMGQVPPAVTFPRGNCSACGKAIPTDLHEFHRNGCSALAAATAGAQRTMATAGTAPAPGFDRHGNCFRCHEHIEPDLRGFHAARCA